MLKVAEAENHDTLQKLGKANVGKEIQKQHMCINVSIFMSHFGQQQISVLVALFAVIIWLSVQVCP